MFQDEEEIKNYARALILYDKLCIQFEAYLKSIQEAANTNISKFSNTFVMLTAISFIPAYIPCLEYVERPTSPVILLIVDGAICFIYLLLYGYMRFFIPWLLSRITSFDDESRFYARGLAESMRFKECRSDKYSQELLKERAYETRANFHKLTWCRILTRPLKHTRQINRMFDYSIFAVSVTALITVTVFSDLPKFEVTQTSQLVFAWCIFFVNIFIRIMVKDSLDLLQVIKGDPEDQCGAPPSKSSSISSVHMPSLTTIHTPPHHPCSMTSVQQLSRSKSWSQSNSYGSPHPAYSMTVSQPPRSKSWSQ